VAGEGAFDCSGCVFTCASSSVLHSLLDDVRGPSFRYSVFVFLYFCVGLPIKFCLLLSFFAVVYLFISLRCCTPLCDQICPTATFYCHGVIHQQFKEKTLIFYISPFTACIRTSLQSKLLMLCCYGDAIVLCLRFAVFLGAFFYSLFFLYCFSVALSHVKVDVPFSVGRSFPSDSLREF
jgi:hypothetical protein